MAPDYLPAGEHRSASADDKQLSTRYLSDWTRVLAHVGHLNLEITSPQLEHLVIHSASGRYCCVEPVSHLAGTSGVRPDAQDGALTKLRPKERMNATINFRFGRIY